MSEILRVENLRKSFSSRHGTGRVYAVDDVSFSMEQGETLGVVGESGCGKSTLGRTILRLLEPTEGAVYFEGRNLRTLTAREMRAMRRELQMVFQDPFASLDPRMTVEAIVSEPMLIHGIGDKRSRRETVQGLLDTVGLPRRSMDSYPHEFSGGQRQRIGIARSLAVRPKLVVADEPVSALDVSIQAQILNLLVDLKGEFGLSYIFIAHDLAVVEHVSDRLAVMYLGRFVEYARSEDLFASPSHPYTKALMASVPQTDPEHVQRFDAIEGELPNPENPPPGCPFHPRCPAAMAHCASEVPGVHDIGTTGEPHEVRCHLFSPDPALNGSNRTAAA